MTKSEKAFYVEYKRACITMAWLAVVGVLGFGGLMFWAGWSWCKYLSM